MKAISQEWVRTMFDSFNSIGETSDGMQRLAYTIEEKLAKDIFVELCANEGLNVTIDTVGNIIATREGALPHYPAIAMGSHLDTVYTGGKYDGVAGVVAALEVIRRFNSTSTLTKHPLEVIVFAGEESARFGMSTIGSKAMAGLLSPNDISKFKDRDGITLFSAMEQYGINPANINQAKRDPKELKAFLELHVEQGPELEKNNKKIAITTGIAAPTRLVVEVIGVSAHSGTTSMENRRDALTAASKFVLAIEEAAKKESQFKTVATVGVFDVKPGAMNVIPGKVEFKVDIRGIDVASKHRILKSIEQNSNLLKVEKGINITIEILSHEEPILMDEEIQHILHEACRDLNIEPMFFPSGAGHDAMNMAKICPTGLLFVPSKSGISHNPEEHTLFEDIVRGADVMEKMILRLDNLKIKTTDLPSKGRSRS